MALDIAPNNNVPQSMQSATVPQYQPQQPPRVPAFLNKLYAYNSLPLPLPKPHYSLFSILIVVVVSIASLIQLFMYSLVNDPETNDYVHWNDNGTSFIIPNSQLMAE